MDTCAVGDNWEGFCTHLKLPGINLCVFHAQAELHEFETRIEQAESVYKDLPRFRARRNALKKALGK